MAKMGICATQATCGAGKRQRTRRRVLQPALWCSCGRPMRPRGVCCPACSARRSRNRVYFGGLRDQVAERDGNCCRGCFRTGALGRALPVHHRSPGVSRHRMLITLCPACHATVHKLMFLRKWLPPLLRNLWREQHPSAPEQLFLEFDRIPAFRETAAVQPIGVLFE